MRLAIALAVIAVAWPAALYLHQRHVRVTTPAVGHPVPVCAEGSCYGSGTRTVIGYRGGTPASTVTRHPSWEDPTALAIAIGGLALGVGIAARKPDN